MFKLPLTPVLSCEEAREFEAEYFRNDETREWAAMRRAGRALGRAVARDFEELGGLPPAPRVLVLAGKGHNAGDALIAAGELRALRPAARIEVVFVLGERALRPLAARAWRELQETAGAAVRRVPVGHGLDGPAVDVCLDGVFGFQFRPPLPPEALRAFGWMEIHPLPRLRAAVDLPSGLGEPGAFTADFTYATGIVKRPLLELPNAGRPRFLDLGFPLEPLVHRVRDVVMTEGCLASLRALRPARCDKRDFGWLLVVAGSRSYPGAALMATEAALRAGAGLVTAAVPESLVPAFAARLPEAIWLGLPETPDGGLALEGFSLIRAAFERASAVLLGPGLGRERETLALAAEVARASPHPLVIDADALQPEIVAAGQTPRVLTPHAGEYTRIEAAVPAHATVIRKGPISRVETPATGRRAHSFFGGPVLARGGSGDILAGLIAGLLAQHPDSALQGRFGRAKAGLVWHGLAADLLARAQGAQAVRTTQLFDYLAPALRAPEADGREEDEP